MTELVGVVSSFPHTSELVGATTEIGDGVSVTFLAGQGAPSTRSMLRELAYDVCGMPIVNYMSAREHGLAVTALPVFPTRRFLHGMLVCDRDQVRSPADLEGKRVGIGYYGNTDSTWVRGLLSEYGVDLGRITWVTSSEEQVQEAGLPANVVPYRDNQALGAYTGVPGGELDELLLAGEVAGVIYGRGELIYNAGEQTLGAGSLGPLFDDVRGSDRAWFERAGFFPMMTVVVVKDSVLAAIPGVARMLVRTFTAAKERALAHAVTDPPATPDARNSARISGFAEALSDGAFSSVLGPDPLPYGVEPNRTALETIITFAHEQRVLRARPSVDGLFVRAEA